MASNVAKPSATTTRESHLRLFTAAPMSFPCSSLASTAIPALEVSGNHEASQVWLNQTLLSRDMADATSVNVFLALHAELIAILFLFIQHEIR